MKNTIATKVLLEMTLPSLLLVSDEQTKRRVGHEQRATHGGREQRRFMTSSSLFDSFVSISSPIVIVGTLLLIILALVFYRIRRSRRLTPQVPLVAREEVADVGPAQLCLRPGETSATSPAVEWSGEEENRWSRRI